MERFYSISEFKKQMLDYFELSRNNLEKKIHLVTNEINSIKKENIFLQNKFKDLISKLSYNDENLTSSFLTDIQNKTISSHSKSPSKINIQNILINKKIFNNKHFSKLKIHHNKNDSKLTLHANRKINRSFINQNQSNTEITNEHNKKKKISTTFNKKKTFDSNNKYLNDNNDNNNDNNNNTSFNINNYFNSNNQNNLIKPIDLKFTKDKHKIFSTKFSITDIPRTIYQNKNNDKFFEILSKSNFFSPKIQNIFNHLCKNSLLNKEKIVENYKIFMENKKYKPSKTLQIMLNLIKNEDEKNLLNYDFKNDNDNFKFVINAIKIIYIILNVNIPNNNEDIIKNFFTEIYKNLNINNIKELFEIIKDKINNLEETQIKSIKMIIDYGYLKNDNISNKNNNKLINFLKIFGKEISEYFNNKKIKL